MKKLTSLLLAAILTLGVFLQPVFAGQPTPAAHFNSTDELIEWVLTANPETYNTYYIYGDFSVALPALRRKGYMMTADYSEPLRLVRTDISGREMVFAYYHTNGLTRVEARELSEQDAQRAAEDLHGYLTRTYRDVPVLEATLASGETVAYVQSSYYRPANEEEYPSGYEHFRNEEKSETAFFVKDGFAIKVLQNTINEPWDSTNLTDLQLEIIQLVDYVTAPNLDTADTWAHSHITSALAKGFVPADIQDNYTNNITRAEFCRMAVKWVEYATEEPIALPVENPFTDTDDPAILAAYALGITAGTSETTFTPDGQFTRQQAATMLMNTCRAIGMDVESDPSTFADIGDADDWALPGIAFVQANGIMEGKGGGHFAPNDEFTVQESITVFDKMG